MKRRRGARSVAGFVPFLTDHQDDVFVDACTILQEMREERKHSFIFKTGDDAFLDFTE
jgi:hypothetical protein